MRAPILLVPALVVLFSACRTAPVPQSPLPRDAGYERWKHYYEERAYPDGSIPANARGRALDEAAQRARVQSESAEADAVAGHWRSLGPTPVRTAFPWQSASGRINALAISPANPNLILAGASSGGVWRSTDGGTTFIPASDGHVDLSIGAIAFAPSNPNVVYAAMGSDFLGTGILRSDDAGATWRDVSGPTFSQRGTSLRVGVDGANPDRLWVMQTSREVPNGGILSAVGLYASEDGGVTWKNVLAARLTDFLVVPGTSDTLLAAVGESNRNLIKPGVHKSVDGGKSWTLILPAGSFFPTTGEFVLGVPASMPNRYYAYGSQDRFSHQHSFHVSNDAGATWTRTSPKLPAEFPWYLGIDAADPNTLYIGFRDAYRSRDGGATWTNVTKSLTPDGTFVPHLSTTHIDQHSFASAPGATYLGNDGGIFRSNDGGTTYTSLAATLSVIQAYGVSAHPTDPSAIYLGTQDNGIERRDANGVWRELVTGDYGSVVFDANNPSRVATNYIEGQIFLVDERGGYTILASHGTWGEPVQGARIAFIAPLEQSRTRGTLYFGTYRLFVSDNFGTSWRATSQTDLTHGDRDRLRAIGISESDPLVVYTGSQNGRVMVSRDGGFGWTDVTRNLPVRTVKSFAVDSRNSAVAYVALSGYGSEHVFMTRDAGASWSSFSAGLPDVPVNALLIDPNDLNVMYAGTDIGVFRKAGDEPWVLFNHGMPPVLVNDFAVTADRRVVLATYGRGAYELVKPRSGTTKRRSVR
ncbi:MAG TPA: hypothetical protein VF911_04010 [Thermoanaerobaculia bacterium]